MICKLKKIYIQNLTKNAFSDYFAIFLFLFLIQYSCKSAKRTFVENSDPV